jgi:hypothetical protein
MMRNFSIKKSKTGSTNLLVSTRPYFHTVGKLQRRVLKNGVEA